MTERERRRPTACRAGALGALLAIAAAHRAGRVLRRLHRRPRGSDAVHEVVKRSRCGDGRRPQTAAASIDVGKGDEGRQQAAAAHGLRPAEAARRAATTRCGSHAAPASALVSCGTFVALDERRRGPAERAVPPRALAGWVVTRSDRAARRDPVVLTTC